MRTWRALVGCILIVGSSAAAQPKSPAEAPAWAPTWWAVTVSGEKEGTPTFETTTPETMGGTVKRTGAWTCSYAPTARGEDENTRWEQMDLTCSLGDAEAFVSARCAFRAKPKSGVTPGKRWKRGELQTLNLRRRGDAASAVTVSLRCDVDQAFAAN